MSPALLAPSRRFVAAVGDVATPNCWSGIPYHFWRAATEAMFATGATRLDLGWSAWPRRRWNLARIARGLRPGGFQYSPAFLANAERRVPRDIWASEVISFSQHFPRAATVRAAGGRISYYIDATFAALSSGRGLDLRLPEDVVRAGRALERQNYELADRVIAMASWTAESLAEDCGVPAHKIAVVLPGANLDLPDDWLPEPPNGRPGLDRPFVLGFVGKDWVRKGLPLVCKIRNQLAACGWQTMVLAAGSAPPGLNRQPGVEFVGFIDKRSGPTEFAQFLARCDVGCLFSEQEALGISTLEFLRAGVPVAGYAIEGPADTIPVDAGFRFAAGESAEVISAAFDRYLRDETRQRSFRQAAASHAQHMTWRRCVRDLARIWAGTTTGGVP